MSRDESLLAVDEAAAVFRIKTATLYDWAKKGVVPHVRILAGRRRPVIRFRREDLARFIENRTVRPASDRN